MLLENNTTRNSRWCVSWLNVADIGFSVSCLFSVCHCHLCLSACCGTLGKKTKNKSTNLQRWWTKNKNIYIYFKTRDVFKTHHWWWCFMEWWKFYVALPLHHLRKQLWQLRGKCRLGDLLMVGHIETTSTPQLTPGVITTNHH